MISLQQDFPLSTKKFRKKIINPLTWSIFIWVIIGVVGYFLEVDSSIIVISMAVPVLYLLLSAWYIKTYIKKYYYTAEEYFITIRKGVFTTAEIHIQREKIQDVYVDQDIVDRIMGLYDVHVASTTSASSIEAHIDGLDKQSAEGLKQYLLDKISGKGRRESKEDINTDDKIEKVSLPSFTSQEDISNNTYPIQKKRVWMSIVQKIIWSFIGWAAFLWLITSKGNSDLMQWIDILYIYFFIVVIFCIFQLINFFLWKRNYAFKLNTDNIYFKEWVLSVSEKHMPYWAIQDVSVTQWIIDKVFWLGSIQIENAAVTVNEKNKSISSGIVLTWLLIDDANKIAKQLNAVLNKKSSSYGV